MQRFPEDRGQGKHRPAQERSAEYNFDGDRRNRFERLARDTRFIHRGPGVEFHDTGDICDRFCAG